MSTWSLIPSKYTPPSIPTSRSAATHGNSRLRIIGVYENRSPGASSLPRARPPRAHRRLCLVDPRDAPGIAFSSTAKKYREHVRDSAGALIILPFRFPLLAKKSETFSIMQNAAERGTTNPLREGHRTVPQRRGYFDWETSRSFCR